MKKLITAVALCSAFSASASYFDNNTESTETATVLLRCADEWATVSRAVPTAFVMDITGKARKLGPRVSTKTYAITTAESRGMGRTIPGPTLLAAVKITQPAPGQMDAPARTEWHCQIK